MPEPGETSPSASERVAQWGAFALRHDDGLARETALTKMEHYEQRSNGFVLAWVLAGIGFSIVLFTLLILISGLT